MPVKTYRKTTTTKAIQFTDLDQAARNELITFTGGRFRLTEVADIDLSTGRTHCAEVFDFIHSIWIPVALGDWIAEGPKGENYPIAPEVFAATYEEAAT